MPFVPLSGWLAFASDPGNRGARDFAVAEAGSRIVGLLASTLLPGTRRGRRRRHFRIVVHPGFRGLGIGAALFRRLEGQPLPGPRPVLQALCPGSWTLALRFLRRRGFGKVHRDREMVRTARTVPPPRVPRGVVLRPFGRRGDVDAWVRLHAEGYRGDFHFDPPSRGTVRIVLGRDHGREGGAIRSLLVAARHRHRGIGRALLRALLEDFRARDRKRISLAVSSGNAAAIRLYRSEGFRPSGEDITLWRDAAKRR